MGRSWRHVVLWVHLSHVIWLIIIAREWFNTNTIARDYLNIMIPHIVGCDHVKWELKPKKKEKKKSNQSPESNLLKTYILCNILSYALLRCIMLIRRHDFNMDR